MNLIDLTTYDTETCRLLQHMRCSDMGAVDLQCGDGVSWVFGHHDLIGCYVGETQPGETEPRIGVIGDGLPGDPSA